MEFLHPLRSADGSLNQVEQWKLSRHPLDVALAVRERYAVEGAGAIATVPGEQERLKWVGIYPQRQGGDAFMLRIKVPGGILDAAQTRRVGEVVERFAGGPDDHPRWGNRYCDITTRQDIQLHWVKIADVPVIWDLLEDVGMTSIQACGDSARNVLGCPVAGVGRDEAFDATPIVEQISEFFTGNREYANLPRKFKMSVTGCLDDCAQAEINDIGMWPARLADGTLGFNVVVGGGLSDGPRMASDIDAFVGTDEALECMRAIAQVFGELGNRENRGFSRMRYLVQELGPERFRAEIARRAEFPLRPAGEPLTRRYRGDHVGVHPEHTEGRCYVGCSVPVGRIGGTELIDVARLAESYGDGGVRLATDQNFVLTGVAEDAVSELLAEPLMRKYSPRPGPFSRGVVACTGTEYCRFAIVETKERAVEWAEELDRRYAAAVAATGDGAQLEAEDVIRLHLSGCSASCAQPQIADIGLRGETAHLGHEIVEAVDVGLGGSLGSDAAFARWTLGAVPVEQIPALVGDLVGEYVAERSGERFHEWIRRREAAGRSSLPATAEVAGVTAIAPIDETPPYRLRAEMNGMGEAPGKVWFFDLAAAVIDADRCVQCGACIAACPTDSLGVNSDDLPYLVKMCTGCSLCWDFCPHGGLRYEATWPEEEAPLPPTITGVIPSGLGVIRRGVAARVRRDSKYLSASAQDGGVVSALLATALDAGEIDGALVAREDPQTPWRGIPTIATSREEILEAGGSFYNQTVALAALDLGQVGLGPEARIAAVGTPCEIQGIRALQARQWRRGASRIDAITLTIALMCTKSFDYRRLMLDMIQDDRGIDLADVGKVDVIHGRLLVWDQSGNELVDEPVKAFHGAALKGCDECADFAGRGADLSVGSVGSEAGYSSVLARTEAGIAAFARVEQELEMVEIDHPEALEKLDGLDRRIAVASLARPFDPAGELFIDFHEHVAQYGETERAPVFNGW